MSDLTPSDQKVLAWIKEKAKESNPVTVENMGKLAKEVGVSIAAFYRSLNSLKLRGLIRYDGKYKGEGKIYFIRENSGISDTLDDLEKAYQELGNVLHQLKLLVLNQQDEIAVLEQKMSEAEQRAKGKEDLLNQMAEFLKAKNGSSRV